jgi:hypothetical protein
VAGVPCHYALTIIAMETKEQTENIPWMKGMVSCINKMKEEGYTEDFQISKKGLTTFNESTNYSADQVKIVNFYRFEGASDPGDNTILYVIETSDGTKGTLVDGYGAYASPEVSKFIVDVEEIQKKDHTSKVDA